MFILQYSPLIVGRNSSLDPFSTAEIAKRLRIAREALGLSQPAISLLVGLADRGTAWSNYERAFRRIPSDVANRVHTRTGITLNWIYRGDMSDMSEETAAKISRQIRAEARKSRR